MLNGLPFVVFFCLILALIVARSDGLWVWLSVLVFPFLSPIHLSPLPQFTAEATVFGLTSALILVQLCRGLWAKTLPSMAVFCLILAVIWLVQPLFVPVYYGGLNAIAAIVFVGLALLSTASFAYVQEFERERSSDFLICLVAQAVILGSVLQSFIGFAQVTELVLYLKDWFFYDANRVSSNIIGHIGQRNQYGQYVFWGIVATAYLLATRTRQGGATSAGLPLLSAQIGFAVVWVCPLGIGLAALYFGEPTLWFQYRLPLCAFAFIWLNGGIWWFYEQSSERQVVISLVFLMLWFSISLVFSGSRTVLLYVAAMLILAIFWWLLPKDSLQARIERQSLVRWSGAAVFFVFSMQLIVPWTVDKAQALSGYSQQSPESGLSRLVANADDMSARRMVEWKKALMSFETAPLYGVGFMQYSARSVEYQVLPEFRHSAMNSSLFAHSHNIVTQLLAEMGLIGAVVVVSGFLLVFLRILRSPAKTRYFLPFTLLCVMLIHSLLEYPLWYVYFLGAFVLLSALLPQAHYKLPVAGRWLSALLGLGLVFALFWGTSSYLLLRKLRAPEKAEYKPLYYQKLLKMERTHPLLGFYALNELSNFVAVSTDNLAEKRALLIKMAATRPYPNVLLRLAQVETLSGNPAAAEHALQLAMASYPTYAPIFLGRLGDDARWQALTDEIKRLTAEDKKARALAKAARALNARSLIQH
ncbi:MAG: Wzy polymerase domain-containing protein [Neisseriaceae bacterium]|nr:Wzy polymerase domain-containing protein [Neisseriaceae bacterium]